MTRRIGYSRTPRRSAQSSSANVKRDSAGMKKSGLRSLAPPPLRRPRGTRRTLHPGHLRREMPRRRGHRQTGAVRGAVVEAVAGVGAVHTDIPIAEATSAAASDQEVSRGPVDENSTIPITHRSPVFRWRRGAAVHPWLVDLRPGMRTRLSDPRGAPTEIVEAL